MNFKPENYASMSPYVMCADGDALRKTDDDGLRGGVRDRCGTTWWIASQ